MAAILRFVWLSDTHIERDRWAEGEPTATMAYINGTLVPDFVIVTGDLVHNCTDVANYNLYKASVVDALNAPVYNLPGNHDQSAGAFVNYESVLGPIHFTPFTAGPLRIISIVPDEAADLHATISATELAYLEAKLIEARASGEIPLVFSHYPILENFVEWANITTGATELLTLLNEYAVRGYFSGHLHTPCEMWVQDNTTHVNGDALLPVDGDTTDCGMMVCDVYDDRIEIEYLRGTSPHDNIDSLTVDLGAPVCWHGYMATENANLDATPWSRLLNAIEYQGPQSSPLPAHLHHGRSLPSAEIYEALFYEQNVSEAQWKTILGGLIDVPPSEIGLARDTVSYAGNTTDVSTYSHGGVDLIRTLWFAGVGADWMDSGDEARGYLAA